MRATPASLDRYDTIGVEYRRHRRPDPRVAARIHAALGDAERILDIGAGTGSYEPDDRSVVACDPSLVMLRQHPGHRRVRGTAERLPFPDHAFDAVMAIFTVHHWDDPEAGLAELQRVAPLQVLLTFDFDLETSFWLSDYVPAIREQAFPPAFELTNLMRLLRTDQVETLLVPHDCVDGFMAAYWRRPERYLDPTVRANISGLALLSPEDIEPGMRRLADDLESGAWHDRYGHLLEVDEFDAGYRIVVADTRS